jgi:nitrite reductase/ring-hydroxylating ferredoxin subunit
MKVVVARVADFPDGDRKILDVNGRSVGVFRIGDTFYAMRNQCPHHHGPLCIGFIMQRAVSDAPGQVEMADGVPLIACPWHGWEYDLETGQSWLGPGHVDARKYDIAIESGAQVLEEEEAGAAIPAGPGPDGRYPGPYKADLVKVYIEDEFVVIDD